MKENLENNIKKKISSLESDIEKLQTDLQMYLEIELLISNSKNSAKKIMLRDYEHDFFIKNHNCDATITRSNGSWVLKAGSTTSGHKYWIEHGNESFMPYAKFYQKHIKSIDLESGIVYKDTEDKSISNLVAVCNGRPSSSGWTDVKDREGKTPDELFRR